MTDFFDFNSAGDQVDESQTDGKDTVELKSRLNDRLPQLLEMFYPEGKATSSGFVVGDLDGNRGKSLVIELHGDKAGLWTDFATGEGGDVLDLWAHYYKLDTKSDFNDIIAGIAQWLGTTPKVERRPPKKKTPPMDELGMYSGKWDYHDKDGQLIACVYRYDLDGGEKEFRPLDVKTGRTQTPNPRPLYNQPGIVQSNDVILVEGEKCADALIKTGLCATTAMNGANAPVEKTDWSPLHGKNVLIWPDHDAPGRDYAQKAALAIAAAGALSVCILLTPDDRPEKWDAADVVDADENVLEILQHYEKQDVPVQSHIKAFSLGELMADDSPVPDDLIEPRILTPGGLAVLGGPAKTGKSGFVLAWLIHMAAGEPFLHFNPTKRLRIFYLQAEVQYHYLRERVQNMKLSELLLWKASDNIVITPRLRLVLNDRGMAEVEKMLRAFGAKEDVDIIAIDPLRNVFDGGEDGASENDNNAMMFFLKERVERLRDLINPNAGVIIVHHTKKINSKQIAEDPFLSLSGASALRAYYTTGMLFYRPDETRPERAITYELRNGPPIPTQFIHDQNGKWKILEMESQRLVNQNHAEKLDAERLRKKEVILQIIYEEAAQGRVYTQRQFGEVFEGKGGLGAERTIRDRLGVLSSKGYIKFFKNAEVYDKTSILRSKFGYMCVEGMELQTNATVVDEDTGEAVPYKKHVLPTHYKCAQTGAALPVENPNTWIYQEVENHDLSCP